MILYPIEELDSDYFDQYLQIETALQCSVDDFMYLLNNATLVTDRTRAGVQPMLPNGNPNNNYLINAYIGYPSGDKHHLTNRMQTDGVVAVTFTERWPRPAEKKTVLDLIDVFNRIELSEHLSFRSVIVPESIFTPLFESNDQHLLKNINSLSYVSSYYLSSLLTFSYSAFRPLQSNISKTSRTDKKTLIDLVISLLKEHSEYLGKSEMNAFTRLLIDDFGTPMKTALMNLLKKEQSFDLKYIATVFTSKECFSTQ